MPTKVFIVDDSAPIRRCLVSMCGEAEDIAVVGMAETPAAAVEGILGTQPDSVLLDARLQDGSGLDVLLGVLPLAPEIVFVVLTNYPDPRYRKAYLDAGASYFLDKNSDIEAAVKIVSELGTVPRH